jgi:hypothetical protein
VNAIGTVCVILTPEIHIPTQVSIPKRAKLTLET